MASNHNLYGIRPCHGRAPQVGDAFQIVYQSLLVPEFRIDALHGYLGSGGSYLELWLSLHIVSIKGGSEEPLRFLVTKIILQTTTT